MDLKIVKGFWKIQYITTFQDTSANNANTVSTSEIYKVTILKSLCLQN